MQAKIDDLIEQLRRERESLQGGAEQMRAKLQAEIAELKRQLEERTGQLDSASQTILERNNEIQRLLGQIKQLEEEIDSLNKTIADLKSQLEQALASGAQGEQQLREEINRLLKEIEALKVKHAGEMKDQHEKLTKQKDKELDQLKTKYEKMIEELKRNAAADKEHMQREF